MDNELLTRETTPAEHSEILAFYPLAFPDEDLRPVVSSLLEGDHQVLSLATFRSETLVAHILFTIFADNGGAGAGALLAPLGVVPDLQGQGVGNALVRDGLKRLDDTGVRQVFVLGDPAYYGRFGFATETEVLPPYPLPAEYAAAWQSVRLSDREMLSAGQMTLPAPWMKPELW